mmetsp:Transcript_32266/g.102886  ORF Transcript_32266/g.102886 Transcript_32266/m.102886 type:complete len:286 (-) Transcript_32266:357-1214(-)
MPIPRRAAEGLQGFFGDGFRLLISGREEALEVLDAVGADDFLFGLLRRFCKAPDGAGGVLGGEGGGSRIEDFDEPRDGAGVGDGGAVVFVADCELPEGAGGVLPRAIRGQEGDEGRYGAGLCDGDAVFEVVRRQGLQGPGRGVRRGILLEQGDEGPEGSRVDDGDLVVVVAVPEVLEGTGGVHRGVHVAVAAGGEQCHERRDGPGRGHGDLILGVVRGQVPAGAGGVALRRERSLAQQGDQRGNRAGLGESLLVRRVVPSVVAIGQVHHGARRLLGHLGEWRPQE